MNELEKAVFHDDIAQGIVADNPAECILQTLLP